MDSPTPQQLWIPLPSKKARSQPALEATLYLPPGEGPFPTVVFHHGSTGPGVRLPTDTEYPDLLAAVLNDINIAMLVPMRRGRGRSSGEYCESYVATLADARRGISYAQESVECSLRFAATHPAIDASRMVIGGQSRGGFLALWQGSMDPLGCKAVLAFGPGWFGSQDHQPGRMINDTLFAEIASDLAIPAHLVYGRGDGFYAPAAVDRYVRCLQTAKVAVSAGVYPGDHYLYRDPGMSWAKAMRVFLKEVLA